MDIIEEKEKLLIEFILSNKSLFVASINILKPEFFSKPLDRVIAFALSYYTNYKSIPSLDIVKAETKIALKSYDNISTDEYEYILTEVENHCKNEAMKQVILNGAKEINDETCNFGRIYEDVKKVLTISIDKNLGINQFADVFSRHEGMKKKIDSRSIGWKSLDYVLDGIRRGELILFAGSSGGGKSVTLSNVAVNLSKQGLSCLIITLELSEELISKRLDSIITGVSSKTVFDETNNIDQIYNNISSNYGSLYVKKLKNGCNVNDIRSYLLEYSLQFGKYPDVICVDYLDLMEPISGSKNDGRFDKDKKITEELRDLFSEYNVYGFTASQLNRDSIDAEKKSMSHIAGGLSKINTSDAAIALSRTEEQIDKGEIEFQPLKLRNAEMTTTPIVLYWNSDNLQITELAPVKSATKKTYKSKDKLQDLINRSK